MTTWKKTKYVGVRYRESKNRRRRGRPEKYFSVRYKSHGRTIEEGVGWESETTKTGNITPQYCSNLRGEIIHNIRTGQGSQSLQEKRNLKAAKKKADKSKAVTLEQAFQNFLKTRDLKERTVKDYQSTMDYAFPDWKDRRITDINSDSIAARHEKLKVDALARYRKRCKREKREPEKKNLDSVGKAQANLHMRVLRSVLNFASGYYEDAKGEPLIKYNPVERLSKTKAWYGTRRRQTIIKGHELPQWFQAVKKLESETAKDYLLFLLFTGSRRNEGLKLEIEHIDLKSKSYSLIDTKNRQPIALPLPNYLFGILEKRIKALQGAKYIFPGRGSDGRMAQPHWQIQKVIEASGVEFCLHDLRRHFITVAESLDLSVFAVKRLVNHSMGSDVTSGYIVPDVERLRGPMQKIEDKILSLAKAKEPGKVVKLQTG